MANIALALLAGLATGLIVPVFLRPVLEKLRVIDVPNHRSSHTIPVIRGAGVAPLVSISVTLGIALASATVPWTVQEWTVVIVLATGAGCALLGWAEDLTGVPIKIRAVLQLCIGAAATLALCSLYGAPILLFAVGALTLAAFVNVANFMDGIDGISGAHGVVVGVAFAVTGGVAEIAWLASTGLAIAVAFGAFLPWNILRGRMFLGDVGSYLLGGLLGITAIAAILAGVPIVTILAPLSIYLADTGFTLLRRIRAGEKWYEAHRSHVYQRLTDVFRSHLRVSMVVVGFSSAAAGAGMLALLQEGWATVLSITMLALIIGTYLSLARMGRPQASNKVTSVEIAKAERSGGVEVPANLGNHEPMSWAVVGGTGFIGRALVARIRSSGDMATAVVAPRLKTSEREAESIVNASAGYANLIGSLAEQFAEFDVVVNAAGLAAPDSKESDDLWGANALLPVVLARATLLSRSGRFIHLSSAAVQGRTKVLDETDEVRPFSPYSASKAAGEVALRSLKTESSGLDCVLVRATSVQGATRPTTKKLKAFAQSRLSSVAGAGDQPSVVSSVDGLVDLVWRLGRYLGSIPWIVLQPWEGLSASGVLRAAAHGKEPKHLPEGLCRIIVKSGFALANIAGGRVEGIARRLELMWFGQDQVSGWAEAQGLPVARAAEAILASDGAASPVSDARPSHGS